MKIGFEKWIECNVLPDCVRDLFAESVLCYKMSAYRSSYIMSYIAFQQILRDRILTAAFIPSGITQGEWNAICNELRDEDKWDAKVAECVKRQPPKNVFLIKQSVVTQYDALRNVRNTCAHGKSGTVDYYNVDCLWAFIQDNYLKFSINGGPFAIIQMISNHYNSSVTAPGADLQPIVDNIKIGVQDSDLNSFFKDFYQFCVDNNRSYVHIFSKNNLMIDLWDKLMNESEERIHDAIIKFVIAEHEDELMEFITLYPSVAAEVLADASYARKLWTGLLFTYQQNDGYWNVLTKIIEGNMVPDDEKEDFYKALYKHIGKSYPSEKVDILKKTDYFVRLRRSLFTDSDYGYPNGIDHANSVSNHFVGYIEKFGLEKEACSCINTIFSFATFGPFYNKICDLMKKDEILNRYKTIVADNGMPDFSEQFSTEEEQ